MKKRNLFLLLMAVLTILPLAGCKKSPVAVQIDDQKITIADFERYYYTQLRFGLNVETREEVDKMAADPGMANVIPPKNVFMDQLIAQKLVYQKAKNDKSLNKDDVNTLVELATMQAMSQYYLMVKLKKDIAVSDAEVEKFYNENKARFKGTPINTEIESLIRRQLQMEKFQYKMSERVRLLMDESKVEREGFNEYLKEDAKKQANAAASALPSPTNQQNVPQPQAAPQN